MSKYCSACPYLNLSSNKQKALRNTHFITLMRKVEISTTALMFGYIRELQFIISGVIMAMVEMLFVTFLSFIIMVTGVCLKIVQ